MNTEELIKILANDAVAEPPFGRGLGLGLPATIIAMIAALLAVLGPRPDLIETIGEGFSAMRFVLGLGLAIFGLRAVLAFGRPEATRLVALPVLFILFGAIGLWLWAWVVTPVGTRLDLFLGESVLFCLGTIPLLALLPVSVIMLSLRRGAPTRPRWAGAMAGLTGGGLAAAIYALHCSSDSPLFYVPWYSLAIAIVTLGSIFAGRVLLRW